MCMFHFWDGRKHIHYMNTSFDKSHECVFRCKRISGCYVCVHTLRNTWQDVIRIKVQFGKPSTNRMAFALIPTNTAECSVQFLPIQRDKTGFSDLSYIELYQKLPEYLHMFHYRPPTLDFCAK